MIISKRNKKVNKKGRNYEKYNKSKIERILSNERKITIY
jgi:hypothetical protein